MHTIKPPKLLALDIDGTLVKEHTNEVSPNLKKAIEKAQKVTTITLVSARAWKDQKIILDSLMLAPTYHVVENGTKVINPTGKLEYTKHLPFEEVQTIMSLTQKLCHSIGLCIEGKWLPAYINPSQDVVTTLSLVADRQKAEMIPGLLMELPQKYSITVGNHWSEPTWGVALISHQDASKGGGLRYIQEKLGILPEETIAVGDGASDVPMMHYAKVKVAMGNAEQKMKDVATYVAPTVDQDGVADVIEKFVLSNTG